MTPVHPARIVVALAALAIGGGWSDPALATTTPTITDFPLAAGSNITGIAAGPDGALWFTDAGNGGKIGRIDPTSHAITEFSTPTGSSGPTSITAGPDGALWFTEFNANQIGRIDPTSHVIGEFPIPTNGAPDGIAAGPDGALWFTEFTGNKVGRIDPTTHTVTESLVPTGGGEPVGITAGPDGALWFVESAANKIGRIDPNAVVAGTPSGITEFPTPSLGSRPIGIATGPDGALWFTESAASNIGRIDPALAKNGTSTGIMEFQTLTGTADPEGIAAGPDGALWFTESFAPFSSIGRITTSETTAEFAITSTMGAGPRRITAGPDGAMWFTEENANRIGRITVPANALTVIDTGNGSGTVTSVPNGIACPATCNANFPVGSRVTLAAAAVAGSTFLGWAGGGCSGVELCTVTMSTDTNVSANFVADTGSDITLFSAILPESRSVAIGGTATVFGTMINSSPDTAATNCTIQPATKIPATFLFQTTDPKTNALTGTANTPVMIPANQSQSFVLALTPSATINPTDVAFTFACTNSNPAATFTGLNTLLLSAATPQPPDIVALAATVSKDGIVDIPGATGTGFFAVATVNVGTSGAITASADTGAANLPVTFTICETNIGTGQCLAAPGTSVATIINANATPTFAIFVEGSAAVAFSPAANRVFVRFKDASSTVRGETSVAVRTQ